MNCINELMLSNFYRVLTNNYILHFLYIMHQMHAYIGFMHAETKYAYKMKEVWSVCHHSCPILYCQSHMN